MFAKVFEQKWVIRFFGIALILAPFINTVISVLEIPGINKSLLIDYCWQFFRSAPVHQQTLQICSFVIGGLMLRGAVEAWKYTLALLGGYIILQFSQLSGGVRDNFTWMYLGVNIVAFFFIADQLVLKPRPKIVKAPKATPVESVFSEPAQVVAREVAPQFASEISFTQSPAPLVAAPVMPPALDPVLDSPTEPDFKFELEDVQPVAQPIVQPIVQPVAEYFAPVAQHSVVPAQNVTQITSHKSTKKVYVSFEGVGNWGTITDISDAGIRVRAIAPPPSEITARTIELTLSPGVHVRIKFHQQVGAEYTFNFVALTSLEKHSLNQWLYSIAA